jgi:hypothetical protein
VTVEHKNTVLLSAAFAAGLAGLAVLQSVRENSKLLWTFLGTAALLGVWNVALRLWAGRRKRLIALEIVLKKQHYMQACVQGSLLAYWGWYWPPVYEFAPFILAQLLFAYAFDALLVWSRRDTYTLGFAPFPVVISINLFLWFKPDWFYLQFAIVALGLAAKELIRWNRDGRRTHIFNPSSFPLAVISVVLLATGRSDITWGQNIATTQFYPPHMYLVLFLLSMPGQFFFGVTSMIMPAVLATYAFGRLYFAATGIYFFYDSYIPISVFLGMHLLFNDPATSPRTELGRIIYGTLYGLSAVWLYQLLGNAGMPTFYDKLLQVPLLNLSAKWIDRLAGKSFTLGPSLTVRQRNLAYMAIWGIVFTGMSVTQAVGDNHPGQFLPFWRQACQDGRNYACPYLADLESSFCDRGSGWACNEAGLMHIALSRSGEDLRRTDPAGAAQPLRHGCQLGFQTACENLNVLTTGTGKFASAPPGLEDYPVILRGSKGEIRERDPVALYALACHEGWTATCGQARD